MKSIFSTILYILSVVSLSECIGFFTIVKFCKTINQNTKKSFLDISKKFLIVFIILLLISVAIYVY